MGCIEIQEEIPTQTANPRLIETWDVLKYSFKTTSIVLRLINRNMGCIEISFCF